MPHVNLLGGGSVRSEIHATSPRYARKRALASGETTYESGRPCSEGHTAARFTSNGWCTVCAKLKAVNYHKKNPGYLSAYRKAHPARTAAYKAKRRAAEKAPAWASTLCINAVYSIMRSLRRDGVDVSVDHVIPLQGKKVSGLHVRENLKIISSRDNCRKLNTFEVAA
jgi:hypothetical protein